MSESEKRRSARILLIEKEETVARICLKALQSDRWEIEWVATPEAAWESLDTNRPQLVIVGDDFDDCLSFELTSQMRAKMTVPILVLTTSDAIGYQVNCLQSGADDVIVRPIQPPLLLAKVQSQLRRAYRYSVPPQPPRPAAPPVAAGPKANVPTPTPLGQYKAPNMGAAEAIADAGGIMSDFKTWTNCLGCNYMGPQERFVGLDDQSRSIRACPVCGDSKKLSVAKVRA